MSNLRAAYTLTARLRDTPEAMLFRGHRNADLRSVIVKIPHGDRPSAVHLARLRHEHAILQLFDTPAVVRSLGLEMADDGAALVLEDLGDQSLDAVVGAAPVEIGSFLRTAIAMAEVLEAVHQHHIIHKDIKPHHFFRSPSTGALTLIDFGVATRLSLEERRATSVRHLEGTLAYMSPEQTGRMNRVVDRRTDLYSLGVTYYQLLTGVLPFQATDPLELVHSHIARQAVPPHVAAPGTPKILSDIVLKLMSKSADDRYQNVAGLKADLARCLDSFRTSGTLAAFPLGHEDFSDELRIPQKLYGREKDTQALTATFGRVRAAGAELLLIAGYSGIGKSALVGELQRQIATKGHFVTGKFDQLGRHIPYAPISRACGDLVRSVLTESPESIAVWRHKILDAVGPNGQVIVDLVPELALVIGAQPKQQELGPTESQHRFERTFSAFLAVFAAADSPLILFVDDLQWADPASLRLIHVLLTSLARNPLLLIGAYRDNEVDAVHPLSLALAELRKAGVAPVEIKLAPLGLDDATALVADALAAPRAQVEPLARLVLDKTLGNPFFLSQFLTMLYQEQLLEFDTVARSWRFDVERIERATVTDNVVDFMVGKLRRLGTATQQILMIAACVGHQFDRRTLSLVAGRSSSEVAADLWDALREGVVVPLDLGSEYLHEGEARHGGSSGDADDAGLNPSYRFLHDRVQQAAYAMVPERERAQMHLRIGRTIVAAGGGRVPDERLFEVVNHLDLGASLVTDAGERRELARLNLAAGRRALDAAAHASALDLLDTGLGLLGELPGEGGWKTDYAAALAGHLAKAQCAYVMGRPDDAFRVLDEIERSATDVVDRAAALELRILILSSTNRLKESTECGVAAARLLGAVLPDNDDELGPAIGATFGAVAAALGDRTIESLIDLPLMTDPRSLALVRVFHRTIPAAVQYNPRLMTLVVAKAIDVALQRGNSPEMSYFYVCWGLVMAVMGDAERSHRAGQLGLRLNERLNHVVVEAPSRFVFGALVEHWTRPLSDGMDDLQKGLKASLDAGHYFYASFCTMFHAIYRLFRGDALEDVAAQVRDITDLQHRSGAVANASVTERLGALVATLRAGPSSSRSEAGGVDTEAALVASGNRFVISSLFLFRAIERYFASDWAAASGLLEKAWPPSPGNMVGPEIRFFRALVLAERARVARAGGEEAACQALIVELQGEEATLSKWAAGSPGTFGHRQALVAAELASFGTDDGRTLTLYDRALTMAREARSIMHEALAAELAGRFAARRGWQSIATDLYFRTAADAYARWGARSKAKELALDARQANASEVGSRHESTLAGNVAGRASLASAELSTEQLDAMTLVKATQAISTEIVLPKLIATLMRIVIEQAGAECGYLLLEHDGALWVEGAAGGEGAASFQRLRLDDVAEVAEGPMLLPRSIIGYVQRSREKVLLAHADRPSMFSSDPYLARQRPRSLLCLPMVRQGSLVGLLYLENKLTGGAFSSDRVDLLEMLSTQAAISIENAILYDDMEERVEDRTQALEASLTTIQEKQTDLANRNRDMRLVLDNVAQGLMTIDRAGRLSPERSRVVDEWLSPIRPGASFQEYFEQLDRSFSETFAVGFEMLLEDVLPEALAISQLPSALRKGDRHFHLSYEPIKTGTDLTGLLVVIDDVTEALLRARADAEQEEVLALCRHLTQQRSGLLGFFNEAEELTRVIGEAADSSPELRRSLHTLKGNAAMLGLSLLSSLCHEAEETLAAQTFARQHVEPVLRRFGELRAALASLAGERAGEHIQVSREALRSLARQIDEGLPAREASRAVERLTLEPLGVPLARLGEYARVLAGRLNKGELVVRVDDGGLMGDPQRSTPLFATMIHLVRNAVDHGLETEPERAAAHKQAPILTLSTSEEGADLCITVADDGRGIDWDRVRAAAEARGLPTGSREALVEALFAPTISTRDVATAISGRGVGLAAVRTDVQRLGGRIEVATLPGQGTTFRVRVPRDALAVQSGDARRGIEQVPSVAAA